MHEMSIAMEVCRIAQDQVGLAALSRVREIGLVEADVREQLLEVIGHAFSSVRGSSATASATGSIEDPKP